MPQVWEEPTLTAAIDTPVGRVTFVAKFRWVVVPSPSSPEELDPQHHGAPALVSAQVLLDPAARDAIVGKPGTCTGAARLVVVPSPSCPEVLDPQHQTAPATVLPHVCQEPEAMLVNARLLETGAPVFPLSKVPVPS